jgi:hypothetical protein
MKTIFVPSGDHSGWSSTAELLVKHVGLDAFDPSLLITQISPKTPEKAIFVPSGDQAGDVACPIVVSVTSV